MEDSIRTSVAVMIVQEVLQQLMLLAIYTITKERSLKFILSSGALYSTPTRSFFNQLQTVNLHRERVKICKWLLLVGISFAIISFWPTTLLLSRFAIEVGLKLLLPGILYYYQCKNGKSLNVIQLLSGAAFSKWHCKSPDSRVWFFRWMYKAATTDEANEEEGTICTVKQVKEVKLLQRMTPMWSAVILFGLVKSALNIFFIVQYNNMDTQFPLFWFLRLIDIFRRAAAYSMDKTLKQGRIAQAQRTVQLTIIMLGMMLILVCASVAWRVEIHRLDTTGTMSVWWPLLLQFCLLALAEEFTLGGLDKYYRNRVSESMEGYGATVFNSVPLGVGSLLNGLSVYACRDWFSDSLNHSRLDKFYLMLTVVGLVNLFWFIALRIGNAL